MNPVIESLLDLIKTEPLPPIYTSSHWLHFGSETVVERCGDDLILRPAGFERISRSSKMGRLLHCVERLSYWPVTHRLGNYAYVWEKAKRLTNSLGGNLTFNVLKSAVALAILLDHFRMSGLSPRTFALIGDGYGFLGALIRQCLPGTRLYCIDLPKILIFQVRTHETAEQGAKMSMLTEAGEESEQSDIIFVLPQAIERISEKIDCAINIASMQEMNEFSVESYFRFLRRRSTPQSRFYCVNRQSKTLPGGEIANFTNYPWREDDEVFLDGPCPYYGHFLSRQTSPLGPKLLGLRVPFVNYFDGIHLHRLVRLAPIV